MFNAFFLSYVIPQQVYYMCLVGFTEKFSMILAILYSLHAIELQVGI